MTNVEHCHALDTAANLQTKLTDTDLCSIEAKHKKIFTNGELQER